ncbi:MAG: DUF4832 domain-containing protein [Anaerolineales bacterium]|nr:DUF4832 domain-containing protein [Anaerolineales bacterium]
MRYSLPNFVSNFLVLLVAVILTGLVHVLLSVSNLQAAPPEPPVATVIPAPPPPPGPGAAALPPAFPSSDDYLANPGIGWQEGHTFDNPLLPETTAYRRSQYSWQSQNPAENSFDWSKVDADLQAMASQKKQLSFRIYTMRNVAWGSHQVPLWVLNQGAVILPSGEPDYSNCVYQVQWAKFVEAMRQKYDGNPNIAFIDISGYGNFNEWSWQEQTNVDNGSLDAQARRHLADMFIGGSGMVQCRTADGQLQTIPYSYPGFQETQLLMPYAGIAQSTRYVAGRRADVGFRHDCLGSASHTTSMMQKVGDVIAQVWRNAPVVYEFCSGSTSDTAFIANAADILRRTHGSIVHDNLVGDRSAPVLATLLNFVGYRFVLQQINHPTYIESNDDFTLSMTWANLGTAPAYPKMGQDFELHFYLIKSEAVVKDWVINTDIAAWMPADPLPGLPPPQIINQTLRFPASSHSKFYVSKVAIIDKRTGKPINLALGVPDGQGRYSVGGMIVPGPDIKTTFLPSISR